MNYGLHAVKTITRRRVLETLITPGFYIAASAGLFFGYILVAGFTGSIDSGGLTFSLNPVYSQISKILSSIFGNSFVEKLFSHGPFRFAFLVALLPVFCYLSSSSVYKFGFEKNVGALELLNYGPSNSFSFSLAFLLKDLFFSASFSLLLVIFFSISAFLNNFIIGSDFFIFVVMIFFLVVGVLSYGILSVSLTDNAASSLALFFGLLMFFSVVQIGSYAVTGEYVGNLSSAVSWVVRWFSPVFYWTVGIRAAEYGNVPLQLLSISLLIVLSVALLFMSRIALFVRGMR